MPDPDFLTLNVKDIIQSKVSPSYRQLNEFLNSNPEYKTAKGDTSTNLIDQKFHATYNIPNDKFDELFTYLEKCRLENLNISFAEKQQEYSGIMLDFDIYQKCSDRKITQRSFYKIIMQTADCLTKTIKFNNVIVFHAFVIQKPEVLPVDNMFKDGFHILIPEIQITRGHKRYIIDQLLKADVLKNAFREVPLVEDANKTLDTNSAHVPVMFFGNSNKDKPTYLLTQFFKVTIEVDEQPRIDTLSVETLNNMFENKYPVACNLNMYNTKCFMKSKDGQQCPHIINLTYELSLNYSPMKKNKWLQKNHYDVIDALVTSITQKNEKANINHEIIFETDTNVSTLTIHDADAAQLKEILQILPQEYAIDYDKWFKTICAIANTSLQYKDLADWFSQRGGDKYDKNGFEQTWASIEHGILRRKDFDKPVLGKGSIIKWAKDCNAVLYENIISKSYQQLLIKTAFKFDGEIEHANVAKLLYNMIGYKFIVDDDPAARDKKAWFEFVLPGQSMVVGEVYKWRKENGNPTVIHNFMTEILHKVYESVGLSLKHAFESCEDENKSKYYKLVMNNFKTSQKHLNNNTFQNGVIKQAQYKFEQRGFADSLDKVPGVLGVGNGILTFENGKAKLIKGYHDYRISKFTPVNYIPYDAANPYIQQIEKITHDIYPEEDFYHWIWLYFSTLLTGRSKDIFFLAWGPGSCGKSTVAEFIKAALGFRYARKVPINLFTDSKEKANEGNSALMSINGLLFAYSSESKQGQLLNSSRVKELISAEAQSGREMYGKQSEFYNVSTLYIGTNNVMYFDNPYDDAMWRRIRAYQHKTRFTDNPDPKNPYEKQKVEDYMFVFTTQPEYQEAVLSILVHYKEILDNQYGGKLSSVKSKTLDESTAKYRNTQDTINHFIIEKMVKNDQKTELPLMSIAREYKSWFLSLYNNRNSEINDMTVIMHRFTESSLKNAIIMKSADHHDTVVTGWTLKTEPKVPHTVSIYD
jgi:phage/plasmid-associated DNA primase